MKVFYILILPLFLLAACNDGKTNSMGVDNEISLSEKISAKKNVLVEESASVIKDTVAVAENVKEGVVATGTKVVDGSKKVIADASGKVSEYSDAAKSQYTEKSEVAKEKRANVKGTVESDGRKVLERAYK